MPIPQESQIAFYGTVISHIIISSVIIAISYLRRNERTKFLPLLFGINLGVFLSIVFVVINYSEFQPIDFVAFLGYSLIVSYVVTIEIPGYVLLSKHDANLVNILQNLRQKSITLNYNFDSLDEIRKYFNENKKILNSTVIDQLAENFIKRCETIKNLDKSLYETMIKEIGEEIQHISSRSKHPFPKLIEIFSLAGISFLMGQFLNHILS
jgi:F0F1-type ATP synthase assembly protein I